MAFNNKQKSILHTLLYSDIFNFAMTEDELWRGLITDIRIDKKTLRRIIAGLGEFVVFDRGYYSLRGREKLIQERERRVTIARRKLKIAKSLAGKLAYIPTVYFIGVSGRLSHNDADRNDDIDLIFITRKNCLWITRLLVLMTLEFLKVRRRYNDRNPSNKICPNLFLDETALAWNRRKRDLYTAHEICHVYPLVNKKNIYQRFLKKNKWISRFFANFDVEEGRGEVGSMAKSFAVINILNFLITMPFIEVIVKRLQEIYMRRKVTSETILANFLAFHPHDVRMEILNNFALKIKQFKHNK